MKRLLFTLLFLLALPAAMCQVPPVCPTPAVVGGFTSTGGASATGSASTGGQSATGGATATTATEEVSWLECSDSPKSVEREVRKLTGWKRPKDAIRRKSRPTFSIVSGAKSVFWNPNFPEALDQGKLSSCTGNDRAQVLSTQPFTLKLTQYDAIKIYSRATEIDEWQDNTYPPIDEGSSVLAATKASIDLGYFKGKYEAIDTIEGLQTALQRGPCDIGVSFYNDMFEPTRCGELVAKNGVAGGHAMAMVAVDMQNMKFIVRNSWGNSWGKCRTRNGVKECGYAYFSAGTFQKLLNEGAEVICSVP